MKIFLLILSLLINVSYCINGVIWNKEKEKFIPIFDIESFYLLQKEALQKSYEQEKHDFQKESLSLLFHEEAGIITSYNHRRNVKGFFGEIWTFLSEYANFTLEIISVPEKRIGIRPRPDTSYNGLLRYMEFDEADIIAKIQIFPYWLDVVDFLLPLWVDRYRLYIQVTYEENPLWMVYLFRYDTWMMFYAFFIIFCLVSLSAMKLDPKLKSKSSGLKLFEENSFYYLGLFVQRSYYIINLQETRRIINVCACLFSMLLLNFYSAKILSLMVNKNKYSPFNSLKTLDKNTDFMVLAEKDSLVHLTVEFFQTYEKLEPNHDLRLIIKSKRIKFLPNRARVHTVACTTLKNYAIFESEYLKVPIDNNDCVFEPLGVGYLHTWIASGISKKFKYRRTLDRGILKLFESGILDGLRHRLVRFENLHENKNYGPITLNNVYMVIVIFVVMSGLSILILLIECIVFHLNKKRNVVSSVPIQLKYVN